MYMCARAHECMHTHMHTYTRAHTHIINKQNIVTKNTLATSCRQTGLRTIPLAQFPQLLQTQTTVIIHNCTRTAALRFLPCPCAPHDLKTQEHCGQPPLPASPKDPVTSLTSASKQPALSTWSSGNALGLGGNSAEILLFGTLADSEEGKNLERPVDPDPG